LIVDLFICEFVYLGILGFVDLIIWVFGYLFI